MLFKAESRTAKITASKTAQPVKKRIAGGGKTSGTDNAESIAVQNGKTRRLARAIPESPPATLIKSASYKSIFAHFYELPLRFLELKTQLFLKKLQAEKLS